MNSLEEKILRTQENFEKYYSKESGYDIHLTQTEFKELATKIKKLQAIESADLGDTKRALRKIKQLKESLYQITECPMCECWEFDFGYTEEDINIIEKDLLKLQAIESAKASEAEIALKTIGYNTGRPMPNGVMIDTEDIYQEEYNTIQNYLTKASALEEKFKKINLIKQLENNEWFYYLTIGTITFPIDSKTYEEIQVLLGVK